jgi:amidophosphoribosyltransferase
VEAVRRGNPRIQRFDTSVFTGEYITGDITPDYLASLEQERSDEAKQKR